LIVLAAIVLATRADRGTVVPMAANAAAENDKWALTKSSTLVFQFP